MSLVLPVLAVLSTFHDEGDITNVAGDYAYVDFEVPAGTVEIQITHTDGDDAVILDWGAWGPDGFRGWGGGLTDDAIIGVDESSRGYLEGPITPGTWTVVIGMAKLPAGTAHYSIDVTCRDDATLVPVPRAEFDPVVLATGTRWYAGDFHVHSNESGDAPATLDQITALARDRGLDFIAITDHNTVSHLPMLAAAQQELDDLLLIRGIEVTTYAGHGNALGVSDYVDHRVGEAGVSAQTIVDAVNAQGGEFLINHPALALGDACIGCAWEHDDTPWPEVAGVEILTGPYELTVNFLGLVTEFWHAHHLRALVGGSDDHRAGMDTGSTPARIGSPTTMVYADALSEAAILDGIRAGRTVVKLRGPDDPMLDMIINGMRPGDDTYLDWEEPMLHVHVVGGAGSEFKLYERSELVLSMPVDADDWRLDTPIPPVTPPRGLRWGVLEIGGFPAVITSAIESSYPYPPGDSPPGCCSTGTGARGAWPALLAVLALRRRRRPR
jgi:hypothetical protein